jgi:phospholipase C
MTRMAGSGTVSARREAIAGGPGSRVPTLIVSPFAKRGFVDHYDTTSILRFVTKRFALPTLAGLQARDAARSEPQPASR